MFTNIDLKFISMAPHPVPGYTQHPVVSGIKTQNSFICEVEHCSALSVFQTAAKHD